MEEKICEVKWEELRVSPFQPRRHFSESELEELAASIKAVGLIHPPVVRAIENGKKILYYEIIAGERRWRACKKAGLQTLKVLVRNSDDAHAAKSTLIENLQRVNLDPLETAEAFQKLIDIFRMTQEEIAEKVGKKRSTIANYLRLLALPQTIQQSLSQGHITMGHAKAILSLNSATLQQKLNEKIIENQLTVREAEKASQKLLPPPLKKKETHLQEMEEKLQEALGTKVEVESSTRGKGRIHISFYSQEDLERLVPLLTSSI